MIIRDLSQRKRSKKAEGKRWERRSVLQSLRNEQM